MNLFKCGVCSNLSFTLEEEYLLHIRDSHEGKIVNSNMCSACAKTFKTKTQLSIHIKSKCGSEKQYICKVSVCRIWQDIFSLILQDCGKYFMYPGSLHNHKKQHKEKSSYMCRFCAKMFLFAGQLKVHEKIHTEQKDFVCEVIFNSFNSTLCTALFQICGKCFCHRQSLITHISIHTGIKPYQCEGCGKSFSCIGNLLKHRKVRYDSCGKKLLTNHTVKNTGTKIKVCINTPVGTKLKGNFMMKKLEEKLAKLKSGFGEELNHIGELFNNDSCEDLEKVCMFINLFLIKYTVVMLLQQSEFSPFFIKFCLIYTT